ncbi:MAG: pseudouridine synthase [bacterium]
MERLQKVIAQTGYTSRRKAEELITQGRVSVNGEIVKVLGVKVKPSDQIMIDGEPLHKEEKVYYLFYKPAQCVSTMKDEFDRRCVADFFQDVKERVYPVGRLDYDSTGALFMTNDGEFANLMMHPSSHLQKVYDISITGLLEPATIKKLERGIYLEGVKTLPCQISIKGVDKEHQTTMLLIQLTEGKNRQIKKMFESVGHKVKRLHRVSIGDVTLQGLVPGSYRRLKPHEIQRLYAMATQKSNNTKKRR